MIAPLQPAVLGRLLLLQHTVEVMPHVLGVAAFFTHALDHLLPGSGRALLCLDGLPSPVSSAVGDHGDGKPCDEQRQGLCRLTGNPCAFRLAPGDRHFSVRTSRRHLGQLLIAVRDADAFAPYEPFLLNTLNVLALSLENREQLTRQAGARAQLESQVAERTAALLATNAHLSQEIAEHRQAECALRESETRFRQLFLLAPLPLCFVDSSGAIADFNIRFFETFGYTREEIPTLTEWWRRAYPDPDYRRQVIATWQEAVTRAQENQRDIEPISYRVTCKNGEVRTMLISGITIGADLLATFQDISERLRHEDSLRQAKEQAEAANRAKGAFLAGISHEIRTPMNVVLGLAEVLMDSELNQEQRELLARLQTAGSNLLALINQILDLSRIEAGRMTAQEEPVRLRPLLREVTQTVAFLAEARGLALTMAVADGVPEVILSDASHLRQILFNLLGNAVKFTERGHVRLEARVEEGAVRGLHLAVADSGIGIRAEELEALFEPFTRGDVSMTRRHGGTGLGLALSRRLAQLLGGRLWAESLLGVGSVFHLLLPLRQARPVVAAPERAAFAVAMADARYRILLVDDVEDNLLLLECFLKGTPHRFATAVNGEQAVRLIREETFDLVIMDVEMPVMDGYTATRHIRQWERETGRRPLPIFILTGHAMEGEAERSREAGGNLFLTKPLRKQRLLEVIGQLDRFRG